MIRRRPTHSFASGRTSRVPAIRRRSGNPYFNRLRSGNRSDGPGMKVIALSGAVALGLFLIGYLIWGPFFRIKEVAVNGASAETKAIVEKTVSEQMAESGLFPSDGIFFFNVDRATQKIGESFFLDGLDIRKKLPGKVEIDITEKTVRGALLAGGRFLGLDGTGFLVRELTFKEIASLGPLPPEYGEAVTPELGAEAAIIADAESGEGGTPPKMRSKFPVMVLEQDLGNNEVMKIGGQPVPQPVMTLTLQAFAQLESATGEVPIRFISRGPNTESLETVMEGGWKAYFGADQPFDSQVNKLTLILRDKVGSRRGELEYVDLRYGERIFFKFKDAAKTTAPVGE